MGGQPQNLDIYFPTGGDDINGPWPVVVYVHGGGWTQGDKTQGKWLANWLNPYGYMVVTVNYRMYPDFYFPAFIEDPKCAIRFLRAHAGRYRLNSNRIGVWGPSAGGHLALLLGTADKSAGWDVGEYPGQSSRVQAVVNIAGPSDLTVPGTPNLEPLIRLAFNAPPEDRAPYSPVMYASDDDAAFFIVHGDQDDVVPVQQGRAMYNVLTQAGASVQLVIAKNGNHSLAAAGKKPMSPSLPEILQMARNFLDAFLKSP
jgi:acetyl esterase/lipase